MSDLNSPEPSAYINRSIRIFISSTFRDMVEERDELMSHAWPELRRFCRERQVELVEVDLRWGIAEEQATRKETLKLCLDEIHACRPFFIGLLGERYGWVPGDDAFTADLREEQPWLKDIQGRSVTELEILHGVLNNPEMTKRAFFYFRDPAYAQSRGADFLSETSDAADKQAGLKTIIRKTCEEKNIPLKENYPGPSELAALVLEDLKTAIEAQFPITDIPDPLTRDARDHEAFAETRRRTYIGRPEYFTTLDNHAMAAGGPLVLLGDSGSGKSALLANWLKGWRGKHPQDFIIQHYIGGTPDSAGHWRLMTRLMSEIKRWTEAAEELPRTNDDILKDFSLWLARARSKAEHDGVRFIIVLDALNQLEDEDRARLLGWLPSHPFTGALRLIVSTLPGDTLDAVEARGWDSLQVAPLTPDERSQMITHYLGRFGKKLDKHRLDRLANAPAAANPLYLKILLDELRVTGTYEKLEERINDYLKAKDISSLLNMVLARYIKDYERYRPGLVREALGLIFSARRGLTEFELLSLLRPDDQPQLPQATWSPFRSALEEGLVDRGGILNFAHDFLRSAVKATCVTDDETLLKFRLRLADFFEKQPITERSCDELPELLKQTESRDRLRACLLNIDRFLLIYKRDENELRGYWVWLKEERAMGQPYVQSFELWAQDKGETREVSLVASSVSNFLHNASLYIEAEPLMRTSLRIFETNLCHEHPSVTRQLNNLAILLKATDRFTEAEALLRQAIEINEQCYGVNHPSVAIALNNLSALLEATDRYNEAEQLIRRAIDIDKSSYGEHHPSIARELNNLAVLLKANSRFEEAEPLMRQALKILETSREREHPDIATQLTNLAQLLQDTNRLVEAEPLMRRALKIDELTYGENHPDVARDLNILAQLLKTTNRLNEAEPLMRRALTIDEMSYGENHTSVATKLNNLATLLLATNRLPEAEPLMRRALKILETNLGSQHSNVATQLNNLAKLLIDSNRRAEAEPLMRRALNIHEANFRENDPSVATCLNNLATLLLATNRLNEAEPLIHRALEIDEANYGEKHPDVARDLNNLAQLLKTTNRLNEAEPLMRRALKIFETSLGEGHPNVATQLNNLAQLLKATNRLAEAEPLMRRALSIDEMSYGENHPDVARDLNNLAQLLQATNRLAEAEPLMRRALKIFETSLGEGHPNVATQLNNLAQLLQATNRLAEAEPLMRRGVEILLEFTQTTGHQHPHLETFIGNYAELLQAMGRSQEEIRNTLNELMRPYGMSIG